MSIQMRCDRCGHYAPPNNFKQIALLNYEHDGSQPGSSDTDIGDICARCMKLLRAWVTDYRGTRDIGSGP